MVDTKNSSQYWDARFDSGDWTDHGGREQTIKYAHLLVSQWSIASDFCGTILDFGCALGDAIPVYKEAIPKAKFIGLDHSGDAIKQCREKYAKVADFIEGDQGAVPRVDVIITSHTMEHISDDLNIVKTLLTKCRELYVVVPYREDPLFHEHVRAYDEARYDKLGAHTNRVFESEFYSFTWPIVYHVHLKNILRPLFGRKIVRPSKAIMYHFVNHD